MLLKNNQHPQGLGWLSVIYGLYMWSFGTLVASSTLLLKSLTGTNPHLAYIIYATFASLLWTLPIFGGYTSEKIGYIRASMIGILFATLGTICLWFNTFNLCIVGFALFCLGNALFTPSAWCLVDHLYNKNDIKRESGFTLFYLCFNVFTVGGIFLNTNIGAHFGYPIEFQLCTLFCIITFGFLCFTVYKKKLSFAENRSIKPQLKQSAITITFLTMSGLIVTTPLICILLFKPFINNIMTFIMTLAVSGILITIAKKQSTTLARNKIYGFILLCFFATGFWTLYNIEPSLLSVYIKGFVSLSFFGIHLSPDSLWGFECAFIIIIGLFTSRLWLYLAAKNKDPNLAIKFGLALILIASGFIYLYIASTVGGIATKTPVALIIFSYAFFAAGELLIGPLGISMVGKLSPPGREGLFMGSWQLTVGLGAIFTAAISNISTPTAHSNFSSANYHYIHLFLEIGLVIFAAGILVLILSPWVKRLLD